MADPKGNAIFEQAMASMMGEDARAMVDQPQGDNSAVNNEMMAAMMEAMPLRQLISFVPGVTKEALKPLIMALNV
jgi:beta-glucosidase